MKYCYFLLFACAWLCTGCEFETSDNGALDGYWQLAAVVRSSRAAGPLTLDPASGPLTLDQREDWVAKRQFWSFQVNLLQVSDQRFVLPTYVFRFEHQGDSLIIREPYEVDRAAADRPVTDASVLEPYCLYGLEQHFGIERLDDEVMWLANDSLRLVFNRY